MLKCSEGRLGSATTIVNKARIALDRARTISHSADIAVLHRMAALATLLSSAPMSQDMKSSSLEEIRNVHARCNLQRDPHPIRFFSRRPADAPRVQDLDNWEWALQDALQRALNSVGPLTRAPAEAIGVHSPRRRQLLAERSHVIFDAITSERADMSHWPNNIQPRVAGSLAVTRAIGDAYLKDPLKSMAPFAQGCPYITAQPNVIIHHLQPDDRFVVMGSDGLWDHATNEAIIALTAMSLEDEMMATSTDLIRGEDLHPINCVGNGLDAFLRHSTDLKPGVVQRCASMSAGCSVVATAAESVEDCLLGDPTQRLIGYALWGAIDRNPGLQSMKESASPLAELLAVPLARRRGLHDDITAMVVVLPSHLFSSKTPAKLPRQRSVSNPFPAATPIVNPANPFRNLPSPAVRAQPTVSPLTKVPTNGNSAHAVMRSRAAERQDVRGACSANELLRQPSVSALEPELVRLGSLSRLPLTSVVYSRSRQAILAAAAVAVQKRTERSR
jgi:hypothetical protein